MEGLFVTSTTRRRKYDPCKMPARRLRIVTVRSVFFAGSDIPHRRSRSMSSTKPLLWPKPPVIWSYGIVILSVIAVATISLLPSFHLQTAPASLFLCAILFGAWLGGAGPGL